MSALPEGFVIRGEEQPVALPQGFVVRQGRDGGRGEAMVQGFNSAVPFGKRIAAGLGAVGASALTGENIGDLYNEARLNQAATSEAHPNAELGGSLLGIAATLPVGLVKSAASTPIIGPAANAISKASTQAGSFVRGGQVAQDASRLTKLGAVGLRSAKGAALAAPVGAVYAYGDAPEGKRLQAAASGARMAATIGGAIPVAGAVAGSALNAVAPKVSEGLVDIAKLARENDIPLSLDQVSDSRALKNIQKVSQELPLSGQSAFRQKQMLSFNRALFKTVGVDADMFTTKTMNKAFDKVGGEFDSLTKGKDFNIGGDFINNLTNTADEVQSQYGNEAASIFQKEAGKVINDFGSGDTISGDLISKQRARINKLARNSTDPNIKGALLDLENNIVDGITGGDEAAQQVLSQAKQRYKNLIVLEPIANKAKGGFISPSLLNQRVSQVYKRAHTVGESGKIGDLARIGHELLPELGGSDTVQKSIYAMAGANLIGVSNALAAVGANRAFQSGINRNQGLIDNAILKQALKLPPAEARKLLSKH